MRDDLSKTAALIGNAPPTANVGPMVDRCKHVVRINACQGYRGAYGSRVDDLALVNCGGQMREWLTANTFDQLPAFADARRILLPIHPSASGRSAATTDTGPVDGLNFAAQATGVLSGRGKNVATIPGFIFEQAAEVVQNKDDSIFAPSTGFILLHWLLTRNEFDQVMLCGFTFRGWGGHNWDQERSFVVDLNKKRRVLLIE